LSNGRDGSGADVTRDLANVRFAPQSGQSADMLACPLCANRVLTHRSKKTNPSPRRRGRMPRDFAERDLWKVFPISSAETSSLRLDVGGPDHLAPFLGFFGDQLAELGRRSRQRRAAEVSETGLHLRVVESRVDLLIELVDDLGRRGLRYAEAVPITPLVARQELTHGRDVRQRVRARRSSYCERTQPASPDVLDGRRHCRKAYLYLPREEIGQSRPCATIENVH